MNIHIWDRINVEPKKEFYTWFCPEHQPKDYLWSKTHFVVKTKNEMLRLRDEHFINRFLILSRILSKKFTKNVSRLIAFYAVDNICYSCKKHFSSSPFTHYFFYHLGAKCYSPIEITLIEDEEKEEEVKS